MGNRASGWCRTVDGCDRMLRSKVIVGRGGGLIKRRIECHRVIHAYNHGNNPRLPRRTQRLLRFLRDGRPGNSRGFFAVPVSSAVSPCVLVRFKSKRHNRKTTVEIIELVRHQRHPGVPLWVILACLADQSRRTDSRPDQGVEHEERGQPHRSVRPEQDGGLRWLPGVEAIGGP